MIYDRVVVGAGVVGLSTAMALLEKAPEDKILILDKENEVAFHQSGHNSGVIHSGIYYRPGSFKARFARAGNRSMVDFCRENNIEYRTCGKLIVAVNDLEIPLLENLYQRGLANEIQVEKLGREALREREPHVRALAGLLVKETGVVDFKKVAVMLGRIVKRLGGEIRLGASVQKITQDSGHLRIETSQGDITARFLVNCAGLECDRVVERTGVKPEFRIIPFRGEYYSLRKEKAYLVKNLIYPVPNPEFPFLGVHFTRGIDGDVHAGPNAVLALKREGYTKTSFQWRDFWDTVGFPGFWKFARKYKREGWEEMKSSWCKRHFISRLKQLIPEIEEDDLTSFSSGVRAQAMTSDGSLIDDFKIVKNDFFLHVCNAPSPAATSCLEIGKYLAAQIVHR